MSRLRVRCIDATLLHSLQNDVSFIVDPILGIGRANAR